MLSDVFVQLLFLKKAGTAQPSGVHSSTRNPVSLCWALLMPRLRSYIQVGVLHHKKDVVVLKVSRGGQGVMNQVLERCFYLK